MSPRRLAGAALLPALLLFVSTASFAQKAAEERPWAKGVSKQNQDAALELFRQGNGSLKESLFVDAVSKYREALKLWDHPAIHYNLALALLNLDQPVELHEHLLEAMKFGPAPLDSDKYEQATRYKALVERQLSTVKVSCDVAGASVKLDGKQLFIAPGKYEGVVRSGPHAIVASAEGYLTREESKSLPPGEVSSFDLQLFKAGDLTQYRRRWDTWVPWSVVAAGAAVVGTGVALHMSSNTAFKSYDSEISNCSKSSDSGGCIPTPTVLGEKSRGETMQTVAVGAYALGGAAIATGAVLVYMNRLLPYEVSPGDKQVDVAFAPVLAPNGAGASALVRF